ncbi:hypothetical protein IRZ71_08295 [Flavobacterium sp. ANB]|uniref:hypothetical protein n=1 Tax=unclassified Flavobacterium TaxID=196869 RepID=UPI0012B7B7EF|nr:MULTISPECIES: hypothetical protein [unclassified Flavobacterium]MBF4516339.1 hypothetical protein [Flavobacterium sp. ANB]MTD69764.1 hypothetical protein [Flavobacterium sp. LC2016-13]
MKIILERSLDFRQFQNLIILTFITGMVFLGMLNSVDFKSYYIIETILLILNIIFIAILFFKKGLLIENQKLYNAIFLFGFCLRKKLNETSEFQQISIMQGKLSTNYGYSYDIKEFHNWEPELNHSISSFTIFMVDERKSNKKKILRLAKPEKVKLAIDFITKNTDLKF